MQIEYQETHKDLQTRIDIHSKYGSHDIDTWMLDLLQPEQGIQILDVACGAGKQLAAFHKHLEGNADIVGGDVSAELLEQARGENTPRPETVSSRQDFHAGSVPCGRNLPARSSGHIEGPEWLRSGVRHRHRSVLACCRGVAGCVSAAHATWLGADCPQCDG